MANRCLRPAQGLALRIARLDAAGATPAGATNMYVTDAFTRFGFAPEIEDTGGLEVVNAKGGKCVDRAPRPLYRWWNVALDLCFPDPEMVEMICGALLITQTTQSVGAGVPLTNNLPAVDNGVSLEIWTYALDPSNSEPNATAPYIQWAFPMTKRWRMGELAIENGVTVLPLTGHAIQNAGWGNGPDNLWTGPAGASARAVMWMETATLPTPACGYVATPVQT